MIEALTISENRVATPSKASFSEAREPQRGVKEAEKHPEAVESSQLSEIVSEIKHQMIRDVGLQFNVHEDTGRVVVTVIEESTGQVIREIPPSEVLRLAASFEKTIGIIFDQKG